MKEKRKYEKLRRLNIERGSGNRKKEKITENAVCT
jgi:hypothetical protein